jgi:phosphopantothenate---cysteine ligase (CTP)
MNVLVTAGNTQAPLDRVRCITNIFSGRTGTAIARTAWERGHNVTLLTSNPDLLKEMTFDAANRRFAVIQYQTFDDLAGAMPQQIKTGIYDVVIHSAAVSDYLTGGVYAAEPGTFFAPRSREWGAVDGPARLTEQKAGKIKSAEPELWIRLVKAPKLIDRVRKQWNFNGLLVKFKLEVGLADAELLQVAEESRKQSAADLMVANTLDSAKHLAFVGPIAGRYERVPRRELAERLILVLEELRQTGRGTWSEG